MQRAKKKKKNSFSNEYSTKSRRGPQPTLHLDCTRTGATNSGAAREQRGSPSFPREVDAEYACACVPLFLFSRFFFFLLLFPREEEPVQAVNQSPQDDGEAEASSRKSHGGPGLMAVRLAC